MTREDPQMKLRMPQELRDQIADAAQANHRSMNAEIVARLQTSFDQAEVEMVPKSSADMIDRNLRIMIDAIETRYEKLVDRLERKAEHVEAENEVMRRQLLAITEDKPG